MPRTVQIGAATVLRGDCIALMPTVGLVDAVVTDPPYGLEFMGKEWDKLDVGLPQEGVWKGRRGKGGSTIGADDSKPASRHHVGYGAQRHGFKRCLACGRRQFSGSPCKCADPNWLVEFSQGAPSSVVRMQRWHDAWACEAYHALKPGGYLLAFGGTRTHHRLWCAIEDAGFVIQDTIMWLYGQGFPKGRTQLKPAFEPICVAYKPGGPRTLQIDECRIEGVARTTHEDGNYRGQAGHVYGGGKDLPSQSRAGEASADRRYTENGGTNFAAKPGPRGGDAKGRWAANVCHSGDDEVMEAFAAFGAHPGCKSPSSNISDGDRNVFGSGLGRQGPIYPDSGTAARFFYCAKAGKADRAGSKHPTVKPIALMRWLVRLVTPPSVTVLKCVGCGHELPYPEMLRVREEVSAKSAGTGDLLNSVPEPNSRTRRQNKSAAALRDVRGGISAARSTKQILLSDMPGGRSTEAAADLSAVRQDIPASTEERSASKILLKAMRGQGSNDSDRAGLSRMRADLHAGKGRRATILRSGVCEPMEREASSESERTAQSAGLYPDTSTGPSNGHQRGLCDGASAHHGRNSWSQSTSHGSGPSQEWGEGRQSHREPGTDGEETARRSSQGKTRHNRVSVLQSDPSNIERCPCCGGNYAWVERPGIVLDPFAGSGTTGAAALGEGRRVILIEREPEYIADIKRRLKALQGQTAQAIPRVTASSNYALGVHHGV